MAKECTGKICGLGSQKTGALVAKLLASAGLRAPPLLQALWRAGLCQALLRPGAWLPEGCSLLRGTGKAKMCREI